MQALAAAGGFAMALRTDGTVWTWGENQSGQLGDGTTVFRATPAPIPGLTGIVAVEAGSDYLAPAAHALALKSDGTVWAWGANGSGQLGDGSGIDRHAPVQVSGIAGATKIAAGGMQSFALVADGSALAWGSNFYGQLGDGGGEAGNGTTAGNRLVPVSLSSLAGVGGIATGLFHSLAWLSDGSLQAWGANDIGQVGDGTAEWNRITPVPVGGLAQGVQLAAVAAGTLAFSDSGLAPASAYYYTVRACDAAGNCSAPSALVSATTLSQPDTGVPSVPAGLTATAVSSSQIDLSWTAATDNVGVTAYQVFRGGAFRATVSAPATSFSDTGLSASTPYDYAVAACDAAGNCSALSATASATTLAPGASSFTASLLPGFNLIGNALNLTLDIAAIFGNQDAPVAGITPFIVSVWKWNAAAARWSFYSPQLTVAQIAAYAAAHNHDVLASIAPGDGYWVNAVIPMALPAQTGTTFNWTAFSFATLPPGFNLITHATARTPSQFNIDVSLVPPGVGVVPIDNFLTLWAWDAAQGRWYFHSPLLESTGGLPTVKAFADSHFFLHFPDFGKKVGSGVGFWVNRP